MTLNFDCILNKIILFIVFIYHAAVQCPTNQVFKECGSMCERTCQLPTATCEDHSCIDGCFCPDGMVLLNDTCVHRDQCPCFLGGKEYVSGDVVPDECNKW